MRHLEQHQQQQMHKYHQQHNHHHQQHEEVHQYESVGQSKNEHREENIEEKRISMDEIVSPPLDSSMMAPPDPLPDATRSDIIQPTPATVEVSKVEEDNTMFVASDMEIGEITEDSVEEEETTITTITTTTTTVVSEVEEVIDEIVTSDIEEISESTGVVSTSSEMFDSIEDLQQHRVGEEL